MVLGYIHLWEWGDTVQPITPPTVQMAMSKAHWKRIRLQREETGSSQCSAWKVTWSYGALQTPSANGTNNTHHTNGDIKDLM